MSSVAEELFMKSLKMYETLVGENHLTLQPLKNLGTFYMQRNRYLKLMAYVRMSLIHQRLPGVLLFALWH